MRVIEVSDVAIRAVAVSPDSRFVATFAGDRTFGVFRWATGEAIIRAHENGPCYQMAFGPTGEWLARSGGHLLRLDAVDSPVQTARRPGRPVRRRRGRRGRTARCLSRPAPVKRTWPTLERWSLPRFRTLGGFDFWSPFRRPRVQPGWAIPRWHLGVWVRAAVRDQWRTRLPLPAARQRNPRKRVRQLHARQRHVRLRLGRRVPHTRHRHRHQPLPCVGWKPRSATRRSPAPAARLPRSNIPAG